MQKALSIRLNEGSLVPTNQYRISLQIRPFTQTDRETVLRILEDKIQTARNDIIST